MFAQESRVLAAVVLLFAATQASAQQPTSAPQKLSYPQAQRTTDGDLYHGTFAADPYRWLESHNGAQTKTWLSEQATLARKHLDALARRDEIRKLAEESMRYQRQTVPNFVAGKFYFSRNSGMQDQSVIYRAASLDDTAPEVVLDLNKVFPDAIRTLKSWSVSGNGRYLAYSVFVNGADSCEWRIRDLQTLSDYSEVLSAEFDYPSWHSSLAGFYYSWKGAAYFHQVGTSWATDQHIYGESGFYVHPTVTGSGRYVLLSLTNGTDPRTRVLLRDRQGGQAPVIYTINANRDAVYNYVCEVDGHLFFRTTSGAGKGRIVKTSLQQLGAFTEVVPEAKDALDSVTYVGGSLFARYIRHNYHVVKVFDLSGKEVAELNLPGKGTASQFTSDGTAGGVLYAYSDLLTPPMIYRYQSDNGDAAQRTSKLLVDTKTSFDAPQFVQELCFATSKDGTKVPMTLAYDKKLVKDGTRNVLLYGYGGFHHSLTPHFRSEYAMWMRLGFTVAIVNLRGGCEYGEEWHDAGIRLKKQNVFDDYLSAAHWLVDEKYTSPGKIVASGASNGGLLVGAAITQEPDLFGVALPDVGVLDMVRFAKLGGGSWVTDYGDVNDKAEFDNLLSYSPVHRVKKSTNYPAVLVTAPDHDDRVDQAHSWKFTAALQWAQASDRPVLLLVTKNAGHIGGYTPTKLVDLYTDRLAFSIANAR